MKYFYVKGYTVLSVLIDKAWDVHKENFDCKDKEFMILNKVTTYNNTVLYGITPIGKIDKLNSKIGRIFYDFRIPKNAHLVVNTYLNCNRINNRVISLDIKT